MELLFSRLQYAHQFLGGARQASSAAGDQINVARQIQALYPDFFHPAALEFPGDAHARDDGDAHAHLDEALDALDGRHFDGHVEGGAVAGEKFDDAAAEGRFDNVGDEILVAELVYFHLAALGQGMLGGHDQGQLVLEDFGCLQLGIARDKRDGAQVEAIIQHFVGNIAGKHAVDANLHAGMKLTEFPEGGEQGMDGAFVDAEGKLAAADFLQFGQALFDFVAQIDEAVGVIAQEGTRVGQADGARAADKEGLAEVVFELADGQADGGLGAKEALRGTGKAALARDGQEYLEFAQVHGVPAKTAL